MPKYLYSRLVVLSADPRPYRIDQLREAVELLKTLDQTGWVGLTAETDVATSEFKLFAKPFLRLDQILGKTPAQVWAAFDADVDNQVFGLERRIAPGYGQ